MNYFSEIQRSMEFLASKEFVFLGQTVVSPGTACHKSFVNVPAELKIEAPVAESLQMGMAIGMGLQGTRVLNLFPRLNFMLCAIDPLVNFLDKLDEISNKEFDCRIITRTVIGSKSPLWPGKQHLSPDFHDLCDYTKALQVMCSSVNVVRLDEAAQIFPEYEKAYNSNKSSLLIEWADKYE